MTELAVGDPIRWDHGPVEPRTCTETYHVGRVEGLSPSGLIVRMRTRENALFFPDLSQVTRLPQ